MNPRIMKILFAVLVLLFATSSNVFSEGQKGSKLAKVKGQENIMGSPSRTHLNINNISTWIYNNGDSDIRPDGNSGFIFPKGSNKAAVYESGFVWGATVNGEKRVGGSTYAQGLLPGRIIGTGASATPEDPNLEHVRIYRVRKDYKDPNADFSSEVNDGEGTESEVYAQYEKDWNEWPAQYGAPYEDVDGDGAYDPAKDIPGVPGADQTIWYVANDLDAATCQSLYGSNPMGVEMQATFWAYNQTNALGNMIFRKYLIINKSVDVFDSMFVSMWADPDDGDAGDDFSGCDVPLSLMYTYNGNATDAVYGATPPAVGFDFFQGPIVPGEATDEAIFKGEKRKGFKNLPMSVHYFFINGDPVYRDPRLGDYANGTLQFHNLFRGKITTTGADFTDPITGEATKFTLAGDPITGSGWVDGLLHPPGDRRQGMVAGPFTMAPGDTQEVVVAEIAAGAFGVVDRLGAIQLLKYYDLVAQTTYDNFFQVPPPVPAPNVKVTEMDQNVLLQWDANPAIEDYSANGYEFQGYVVYQFPSKYASFNDAKVVATYDIKDGVGKVFGPEFDADAGAVLMKLQKSGSDSGIKREISLKEDLFKSGKPLYNGTPYYFAVTAYALNPNDLTIVPVLLESAPVILEVIPENNRPGWEINGEMGEAVKVEHVEGASDGIVKVNIVNPKDLTGKKYTISFRNDTDTNSATYGKTLWDLKTEDGTLVRTDTFYVADDEGKVLPPVVDGFSIIVQGPPAGIADWDYDGPRWISGVNWGGGWLFGGMDMGFNFFGSTITDGTQFMNVRLEWAGVTDRSDETATVLAQKSMAENPDRWSKGAIYRRDNKYAYEGIGDIPFAAFDVEATPKRRLNICMVENDFSSSGGPAANNLFDMGWDGAQFASYGAREYLFIMNSDYNQAADYDNANFGPMSDVLYAIWPKNRGSHKYLEGEFTLDIIATNVITPADKYEFTVPASGFDENRIKEDIEKINVFPNPYYGVNPNEINKYQRYVTFNHLPKKATIRVFNLAGQLVKTVKKDDNSQFAKWNLQNESDLPVASGLYIVYIDTDYGTKVLKVSIIQETQILDRF